MDEGAGGKSPDGRLVVVNIDAPSPGMVNSGADKVHTLSAIRLGRR